MKKYVTFILSLMILINIPTLSIAKDIAREAHYVLVMDGASKQVLYEKKGYLSVPMASTTKILTALIALNVAEKDEKFEVSKNAQSVRGSKVGYKAGDTISNDELLHGLMFKSGNDAAITLAEGISLKEENFADLMNYFATSLGMLNSNFETVHGLDSANHYTSCYDLAYLTAIAMENDDFKKIVSSKEMNKNEFTRSYNNINKILWRIPNANGVKTGYTGQAGKCLVSSVEYIDRNIIIVVLNCNERWAVTERLFNYVKENYDFHSISLKDLDKSLNKDEKVNFAIKKGDKYDVKIDEYTILNTKEKTKILKVINSNENKDILKRLIE